MRKIIFTLISSFLFVSFIPTNTYADQVTREFATCLTDSMTGKERKSLAKWIFFSFSVHPEISDYFKVPNETKDDTNRFVGELITRLLTEDCPDLAKAAIEKRGSIALKKAFGLVGKVAMQELTRNERVEESMTEFGKYVDKEKLRALNQ